MLLLFRALGSIFSLAWSSQQSSATRARALRKGPAGGATSNLSPSCSRVGGSLPSGGAWGSAISADLLRATGSPSSDSRYSSTLSHHPFAWASRLTWSHVAVPGPTNRIALAPLWIPKRKLLQASPPSTPGPSDAANTVPPRWLARSLSALGLASRSLLSRSQARLRLWLALPQVLSSGHSSRLRVRPISRAVRLSLSWRATWPSAASMPRMAHTRSVCPLSVSSSQMPSPSRTVIP